MSKPTSLIKKIARGLLVFLLINIVLGVLGFFFVGPYFILEPPTHCYVNQWPRQTEELTLEGHNGISISAFHTAATTPNTKGVVVLVHGIGACKAQWAYVANTLAERGFASYAIDLRTHGNSGGEYCTFGYHEKQDVSRIVDAAKKEYPDAPVGIWGNSLGGAISLQSLANDERLEFGVVECTFTSMHQIVYDYHERVAGFVIEPLVDLALARAGQIADFEPLDVSPLNACARIDCPVIIAHGEEDQNIKFEYGQQLFENLKSKSKEFLPIKGGGHNNLHQLGGAAYVNHLIDFVEQNLHVPS